MAGREAIDAPYHPPVATGGARRRAPLTLRPAEFDAACADLMRMVECDFAPDLLVGVRTGGYIVAEAMARAAARSIPVLPLTCRRPTTRFKSLIPGLKPILARLPRPLLDRLRQAEHQLLAGRRRQARLPPVDRHEAAAIGEWVTRSPRMTRMLVVDDAVDSGGTLATVLKTLPRVCPPGAQPRTAVITVTTENPAVEPDYALYRGVLCRFPWSFDAAD